MRGDDKLSVSCRALSSWLYAFVNTYSIVYLRSVHFTLYINLISTKGTINKYWTLVNDMHIEAFRGDI